MLVSVFGFFNISVFLVIVKDSYSWCVLGLCL